MDLSWLASPLFTCIREFFQNSRPLDVKLKWDQHPKMGFEQWCGTVTVTQFGKRLTTVEKIDIEMPDGSRQSIPLLYNNNTLTQSKPEIYEVPQNISKLSAFVGEWQKIRACVTDSRGIPHRSRDVSNMPAELRNQL